MQQFIITHIIIIQYTLENCSVDARFMREKTKDDAQDDLCKIERNDRKMKTENVVDEQSKYSFEETANGTEDVDVSESDSESDQEITHTNPFSALM